MADTHFTQQAEFIAGMQSVFFAEGQRTQRADFEAKQRKQLSDFKAKQAAELHKAALADYEAGLAAKLHKAGPPVQVEKSGGRVTRTSGPSADAELALARCMLRECELAGERLERAAAIGA